MCVALAALLVDSRSLLAYSCLNSAVSANAVVSVQSSSLSQHLRFAKLCFFGDLDAAEVSCFAFQVLIDNEANVNAKGRFRLRPLHFAALRGRATVARVTS